MKVMKNLESIFLEAFKDTLFASYFLFLLLWQTTLTQAA